MFIGKIDQRVDAKGRLSIPSRFREILNSKFSGKLVLTTHNKSYISSYPIEEWLIYQEKISSLTNRRKEDLDFMRIVFSRARESSLDNQGRILIPPTLREYVGIQKEVASVGFNNKIEIWDRATFEEYEQRTSEEIGDIPDRLAEIGFT